MKSLLLNKVQVRPIIILFNYIVVTRVTATHVRRAAVTKGTRSESAGCMTNLTIFCCRYVLIDCCGSRFAASTNTMTGITSGS